MLQAKSETGLLVTLAALTKKEIEKERDRKFFCPQCKERVVIKAGDRVIPHFAHQSKSNCPSSEGGEGAYHEKGKLLLYNWLRSQNLDVKLEKYIKEINQRPDILLKINKKQIAIEYQCSRIPIQQIRSRNRGYKKAGIIPIWILGANRFSRSTKNELLIDDFTTQFIHRFSAETPPLLFYFCPNTTQFIIFQHIYFTTNNRAFGKAIFTQLNKLSFHQIFFERALTKFELYSMWRKRKKHFRLKQRNRLYGRELKWHQWLYLKRTHYEYLPSIVYLPVPMQWQMKSPLWDWQSRIVIDLLDPLPLNKSFTLTTCEHHLKTHRKNKQYFPLLYYFESPIKQYLFLLEQLNMIKQISSNIYQKIQPIYYHNNVESALKKDIKIINKLIAISRVKKRA